MTIARSLLLGTFAAGLRIAASAAPARAGTADAEDPPAHAAYATPVPVEPAVQVEPPADRHGVILGLGGGLDRMQKAGQSSLATGSATLRLGWFVTPRLAVVLEATGINESSAKDDEISQNMYAGAVQIWATPRLWIKSAVGVALRTETITGIGRSCDLFGGNCHDVEVTDTRQSGSVLALGFTAGFDIVQGRRWVLAAAAGANTLRYDDGQVTNLALTLNLDYLPQSH